MDIIERSMYLIVENIEFNSFNQVINNIHFNILEHGFLHAGQDWNFTKLSSPFNRLYFVIAGKGHVSNDLGSIDLEGGNAYIVPLNTTCDYSCDTELHKFYIHFRIELIPGHDLFEETNDFRSLPVDNSIVEELVKSAGSGQIGDMVKAKGILLEFIGNLISLCPNNLNEQMKMSNHYIQLYSYIKSNCYADLRVKNIAKHLNVPMTNLSKNFKNDTGLTLKKYIDDKIVQKAQELLLTTTLPIKNVSYELHFLDEFHFSRFFKNKIGISPNKYRQRNNNFK